MIKIIKHIFPKTNIKKKNTKKKCNENKNKNLTFYMIQRTNSMVSNSKNNFIQCYHVT